MHACMHPNFGSIYNMKRSNEIENYLCDKRFKFKNHNGQILKPNWLLILGNFKPQSNLLKDKTWFLNFLKKLIKK